MPVGEASRRGNGTALRKTPGPPSMRVLSTMVPSTNVMASVSRPKSSPRSRFTRNTTAPIPAPRAAARMPAASSVHRNGTLKRVVSVAVVYMPAPKNAPWPKLK